MTGAAKALLWAFVLGALVMAFGQVTARIDEAAFSGAPRAATPPPAPAAPSPAASPLPPPAPVLAHPGGLPTMFCGTGRDGRC